MADTITPVIHKPKAASLSSKPITGHPQEQFEIIEPSSTATPCPPPTTTTSGQNDEDNTTYPTGAKRWLALTSVLFATILHGLDLTIISAAIPSLTNDFHTLSDIGWYSSAYSLMAASFSFVYGRLYTMATTTTPTSLHSSTFSFKGPKTPFLLALIIFELGSLLCTFAPTSSSFILGRAFAGIGAAGIGTGGMVIISRIFPRHERPFWTTVVGASQMLGIVSSPIVGGALIHGFKTWRGCFGINLPLGVMAVVFIWFGFRDDLGSGEGRQGTMVIDGTEEVVSHELSDDNHDDAVPASRWRRVKGHLDEFDIPGTVLMIPAIVSLLLALQWGGNTYPWSNARIISLFLLSATFLGLFAWRQASIPESRATLPPRILKMRSVLAGAWYSACSNATLAVTEYYVTLYFQGVRGLSATKSGLMILPMLIGITIGGLVSGAGIGKLGWYNPFMYSTTILAPIAAGLLTTAGLDDADAKVPAMLGFLGLAMGLGIQTPTIALQTILKPRDLPSGMAMILFGGTMGNAIWIVVSAAVFQSRLGAEVASHLGADGVSGGSSGNITQAILTGEVGLSEIREFVGDERLRDVLLGYDEALTQTMYLPLGLTVALMLGAVFTEWASVKKKQS